MPATLRSVLRQCTPNSVAETWPCILCILCIQQLVSICQLFSTHHWDPSLKVSKRSTPSAVAPTLSTVVFFNVWQHIARPVLALAQVGALPTATPTQPSAMAPRSTSDREIMVGVLAQSYIAFSTAMTRYGMWAQATRWLIAVEATTSSRRQPQLLTQRHHHTVLGMVGTTTTGRGEEPLLSPRVVVSTKYVAVPIVHSELSVYRFIDATMRARSSALTSSPQKILNSPTLSPTLR